MAELAIPVIALGSMYILSNQDKQKAKQEGLTNMTPVQNALPNVNPPTIPKNFPLTEPVTGSNPQKYSNANQTTDKYFNPYNYANVEQFNSIYGVGGNVTQMTSLTGEPIFKKDFTHNNMVPYFGAKIRGATADRNVTESVLDNMQGQGSQLFRKREQAPMFEPKSGYQYANGTPNMSDFLQSRVNPSMRMANVLPFAQEQVAPALGKGFTTQGSNGFNSGLEARDAWLPKSVNMLRVDNNPKLTFGLYGHEGPADSYVKTMATAEQQGKVEKYHPDKYFVQNPDRWLTTTGLEKAQTARSDELLRDVNRITTTQPYFGGSTTNEASYVPSEYEDPKKTVLPAPGYAPPNANGMAVPTVADYGVLGYNSLPNNRATTTQPLTYGSINGLMKAVVAPLLDIMRPSRKEDVVYSTRPTGNATASVPKGTVFNPADRTKTTIREMTEGMVGLNHLNVENQSANAYLVSQQTPVDQQRDSTNIAYSGMAGPAGAYMVPKSYEAEYMQRNNVNKTYLNRPNQGGTQIFNQQDNIHINKRDADRDNNRWWVPSSGNVAGITNPPGKEVVGEIKTAFQYNDYQFNAERINPDILQAFKSNPYTQSLSSWA